MSSTPFGEHLKREREMRGVSLDEIAAATRISTRFLEAIEKEQWDQLPGGVFNRGFIRSIARFLGLDEDNLVAEYVLGTERQPNSAALEAPSEMPRNGRPLIAAILVAAIVLLAIVGGWFAYRRYGAGWKQRLHKQSPPPGTMSGAAPSPGASAPPTGSTAPDGSPATAPASATAATGTATPASAALTLKVEVGKPADVKVIADGKTMFEGRVAASDVKQFEAQDGFQISTSDSSALVLGLNGQTQAPFGTSGQPGSVTLTRNDVKVAGGGQH
jgi:cytoskeleton protein RodZ